MLQGDGEDEGRMYLGMLGLDDGVSGGGLDGNGMGRGWRGCFSMGFVVFVG